MADIGEKFTITFDEGAKGWPSFHSYLPDWMDSLNGQFYTVKNGQLYIQNDEVNPIRNNFYGEQFNTVLKYIINKFPSDIKFIKAINTESNTAMEVIIVSYLNDEFTDTTKSTIAIGEFLNKEGKFYAYIRRNELTGDLTAKSAYGIGVLESIDGVILTMVSTIPTSLISTGDTIFDQLGGEVGTIKEYDVDLGTITLDPQVSVPTPGDFLYGMKVGRIEGSEIRGYNFEVTLTDIGTDRLELFAVNVEVAKSFPS